LINTYIPSGSAVKKKESTWPFYENLRFLAPTINYRRLVLCNFDCNTYKCVYAHILDIELNM